ncbi:MAG: 6-phosphogluconolactonase, partial [Gemmatimonadota bacterium]|nr:6-phosphogluconolactonase [Gemmatimonadota bacterium]
MHIIDCDDYEHLSVQAGALVIGAVEKRNDLLLCAATGHSPRGVYAELVKKSDTDRRFFDHLRVVQLDEWGGIPSTHPASCEHYLRTRLLEPLAIPPDRYLSFSSAAPDPAVECERVQAELAHRGSIDVCVLGMGSNGHVGFNEPGPSLIPHCHVAQLSEASRRHAMARSLDPAPEFGLTLGLREILASRRIVLLVAG